MNYLFDTNIISELSRPRPNPGVLRWAGEVGIHLVSAVSVEEIHYGVSRTGSTRLKNWVEAYFDSHRVIEITDNIARRAGNLRGDFSRRGVVRTQADMLIAATAQAHGLTLVTRNTRDFDGCGIGLLNPFSE